MSNELQTLQVILFRLEIPVELRAITIKDYFLSWPISKYCVFTLELFKVHLNTNNSSSDYVHFNYIDEIFNNGLSRVVLLVRELNEDATKINYRIGIQYGILFKKFPFYVIENVDCLTEEKILQLFVDIKKQFRLLVIERFFDHC